MLLIFVCMQYLCMCDIHSCLFPYQQASSFLQFCIKLLLTLLNECKGVVCLMWHCTWNNRVKWCFPHESTHCVWMNPGKWKRSYTILAVSELLPSRIIPLKTKKEMRLFKLRHIIILEIPPADRLTLSRGHFLKVFLRDFSKARFFPVLRETLEAGRVLGLGYAPVLYINGDFGTPNADSQGYSPPGAHWAEYGKRDGNAREIEAVKKSISRIRPPFLVTRVPLALSHSRWTEHGVCQRCPRH